MKTTQLTVTLLTMVIFSSAVFAQTGLDGEYWFGSVALNSSTNLPITKQGTVTISDNQWDQQWDDVNGSHTFSSTFTATTQLDGSINISFPGITYNVAFNGDTIIHAGTILGGTEQGMDLFTRKDTGLTDSDILGDHYYYGYHLDIPSPGDSCGWGGMTCYSNGTADIAWVNDHSVSESTFIDWSSDYSNAKLLIAGDQECFLGQGGIATSWQLTTSEDYEDIGYALFVRETDEVFTATDIAGVYQVRFLETGPSAVPYTCSEGTCTFLTDGSYSVDATYSDSNHDTFSGTYTIGAGGVLSLDGQIEGVVSLDKQLIFIPEHQYENPPTRTSDDWLGGIFLIRNQEKTTDINSDGQVNQADLIIMVDQWLQIPGVPSADIAPQSNPNGFVDIEDFALLAEDWLKGI